MADVAVLSGDELRALLADAAADGARRVLAERAAADELLPVDAAAKRLGVSPRAVRHWLATGALGCVELPPTSTTGKGARRVVRIRASEVARFIREHEQRAEQSSADPVIDLAVARALRGRHG